MTGRAAATALALACGCASVSTSKGGTLVPLLPAGSTAPSAAPQRFALLVGIDAFDDPRFNPLQFAGADATELAAALEGFDEVRVLTGERQTRRAAILEALEAVVRKATNPRDTVFLYFSTHGSLGRAPGAELARYLVTSDTRLDLVAETGIALDPLIRTLKGMRAQNVALVVATCHSGRGKSAVPDALAELLGRSKGSPPPLWDRSEAVVVLSAATFGETAEESGALRHDVYTHFFLQGLREGDQDGDCAVTVSEAHDFARARTYAFTQGRQRPSAESAVVGVDPIILRGKRCQAPRPVVFSYAPSAEGLRLDVAGKPKGALPGGVSLEPGPQRVALVDTRSGEVLYQGQVDLRAGDRLDLTQWLPRPPRFFGQLEPVARFFPGSPHAARFLPPAFGARLGVSVRDWPLRELEVSLGAALLAGRGLDQAFEVALPFTLLSETVELRLARRFRLGERLSLELGAAGGPVWMQRLLARGGYSGTQALLGGRLAGHLGAQLELPSRWLVGARVSPGAFFADVNRALGPHFETEVALSVAYGGGG